MATVSFSGLASGIDWDSLIETTIKAQRTSRITPLENKVAFNEQESTALEGFNTLLTSLSDNLLDYTTAYGGGFSKTVSSTNSDAISATATSSALSCSTQLTVNQLAKSATLSFGERFSNYDTALCSNLTDSGTLSFTVGEGDDAETFEVEVTSSTTLAGIVDQINSKAEGSLQASMVNLGTESSPEYVLTVYGVNSGTEDGKLTVSVSDELTANNLFTEQTLEQAQNAEVTIAGVGTVSRATNKITDLVAGLTIELKQTTNSPVTLSTSTNAEDTATAFSAIIDKINEIITYSDEYSAITQETDGSDITTTYAALAKTRIDENLLTDLRSALSTTKSGISGSSVSVLADMGITINRDGTYDFDTEKFTSALQNDANAAQKLIQNVADKISSSSGIVYEYTRYEGHIDTALDSNESENDTVNDRISQLELLLEQQEESMRLMYANLETLIAEMNSEADTLTSILDSL